MKTARLHRMVGMTGALLAGAALLAACGGGGSSGDGAPQPRATATPPAATATSAAAPSATATGGETPVAQPSPAAGAPTAAATPVAQPTQPVPPPPAPTPTSGPASLPQTLTLIAKGVKFQSTSVTAAPGSLTVTLDNEDVRIAHDVAFFAPDGQEAAATAVIAGPGTGSTSFTVSPGTYAFKCTLHANMTGTLTVE